MVANKFTVIDSHCHIYPEKIAKAAVNGTATFYNISSCGDGTVNTLLQIGKGCGIDRFVVQSVATTPHQVKSINEFIASEVAAHPNQLIGLGTMHPNSEDPAGDVAHMLELGLHGVKLHPDIQGFQIDDPRYLKIYALCEANHLPILMHTGDYRYDNSNPNRMLPVLEQFPKLTVIGAHFGGWSIWEEACEKMAGKPNFYVDTSSSLYALQPEKAVAIIRKYGVDRVLFGSDFPLFTPDVELERFLKLPLTDEERGMIFSKNVLNLYGIQ